ncbi:hypothetical protein [Rhizobium sp. FY34]|uniref:hypothetical protein n=1 Tax=Rhizobium sp. FY34 TaxID=2562309 RepID=UPI0010C09A7D|nr:hypothetical protein [Rhizobium sp. FY34]
MDNSKTWYQSKTVWGALIAISASLLQMSGRDISVSDQNALADAIVSLAGAVGGIFAIYGRLSARTSISATKSGPLS